MRQEHEVTSFTVLLSLHFSISPQACDIGNPCKEGEGPFLLSLLPPSSPQVEGVGRGVCAYMFLHMYKYVSCVDIGSSGRDKV